MTPNAKEIATAIAGVVATFDDSPHDSTHERGFRIGVLRTAGAIAYRLSFLENDFNHGAFFAACNLKPGDIT